MNRRKFLKNFLLLTAAVPLAPRLALGAEPLTDLELVRGLRQEISEGVRQEWPCDMSSGGFMYSDELAEKLTAAIEPLVKFR